MFTELKRKIDVQNHEFGWVRFEDQAKFLSLSSKIINQLLVSIISLFSKIFCRFSGIFIEKTTFDEFVEIGEQIHIK